MREESKNEDVTPNLMTLAGFHAVRSSVLLTLPLTASHDSDPSPRWPATMNLFERLHFEGTTIVQVTHSEELAGYARRIIPMKDGWIA